MNNMNPKYLDEANQNKRKRPDLLLVLCVLTFFGSGFSAIVNGLAFLTIDTWAAAFEEGAFRYV